MPGGRPRKQDAQQSTDAPSTVATTPTKTQDKPTNMITEVQKQALVDNLQLEVTERARKLRAQYSLNAQNLRSRLEFRVHRIPQSLRSANVLDLVEKAEKGGTTALKAAATRTKAATTNAHQLAADSMKIRGVKRNSNEMMAGGQSDKENIHDELNMAKKRTRTAAPTKPAAASRSTRTASKKVAAAQVLSPKSDNSQTRPRSPIKEVSPPKHQAQRLAPPVKSAMPPPPPQSDRVKPGPKPGARTTKQTAGTGAGGGPATVRGRRGAAAVPGQGPTREPVRVASGQSNSSEASSSTTIINKKPGPTKKGGVMSKVANMTAAARGKASAAKKENNPAIPAGGRVLRNRK
ncbi:Borealin N terminal-domain-containing protein [Lineolata rhizophorae]|uniref:Borealin N terminal-domain-containing protein n=1 Tax=Lineolata rhizophorae TaxID=578093 RepID=A0A6A6P9C4_9PEZI|nr:Borealin N terminal-domain-containing protein [Lineolata rhizophorae]